MPGRRRAAISIVGVEPEKGTHRDAHRKAAHPLVDVDHFSGAPVRHGPPGLVGHRVDRVGDSLAVEGGHHDPACTIVVWAVDGEQTVAEQRDEIAEMALPPMEVLRV